MLSKINNPRLKRLEIKRIVIEEIYKYNDKIFIRTTDGKENDSVYKATKIEKNFYHNNKLLFREKKFDKEIKYTISALKGDKIVTCTECGYAGFIKEFFNGCPYCKANFNVDFSARSKSYGKTLKEIFNTKWMTILNVLLPIIVYLYYIYETPNLQTIVMGIVILPILFIVFRVFVGILFIPYIFYKLFTFKDIANDKIMFNNELISNIKLIKDINTEVFSYFYNDEIKDNENIIDYDVLDYESYQIRKDSIIVNLKIRKYYCINNKIKRRITNDTFEFVRNMNYTEEISKVKKCPSCGANVPHSRKKCEYCNSIVPSNNLWLIQKNVNNCIMY